MAIQWVLPAQSYWRVQLHPIIWSVTLQLYDPMNDDEYDGDKAPINNAVGKTKELGGVIIQYQKIIPLIISSEPSSSDSDLASTT